MVGLINSHDLVREIESAVDRHQPELTVTTSETLVRLAGCFIVSAPTGPFDKFEIEIGVPSSFPLEPPVVFETGGRIPKEIDRHIFPEHGNCCLGVWEEWLISTPDHTFDTFLTEILHDYFVSQSWFEAKGEWPFGERSHGVAGILECFAELLDVDNDCEVIVGHLKLLSRNALKGHTVCPCGRNRKLRNCHRDKLQALKKRIDPIMAKRMLNRINFPKK